MAFAANIKLVLAISCIVLTNLQLSALGAPQVPCFFIFGDSLVDNGNNNGHRTQSKVDYPPYGIDFPEGPTGRFTNGRNIADFLAGLLGFDTYIPPFATAKGKEIITGVNYASGSSGIRHETGRMLGDNISIGKQLQNHKHTISEIARLLGNKTSAKQHLAKCVYYFCIGSNDYTNNYHLREKYTTSRKYTPEEYAAVLLRQYSQHLKKLHSFGARKFALSGLGRLGCIPAMRARGTNGSLCIDAINDDVRLFNDKLKLFVDGANKNGTVGKYVYVSAMEKGPGKLFGRGNRFLTEPCCKVSNVTGLCIAGQAPCPIRPLHFFYDHSHPTEIVNSLVATLAYVDIMKLIS